MCRRRQSLNWLLTVFIALVWLINGLYCKVFDGVTRHAAIVARILGDENSALFTRLIGILETGMGIWILLDIYRPLNTVTQVVLILAMNIIEATLAPDLLLFGRMNLIIAILFCGVVLYRGIFLGKQISEISNADNKKSSLRG